MTIWVDTRQQAGKHEGKHAGMEKLGHVLVRRKLDVGDYMAEEIPGISVDTKQDPNELYADVVRDRSRFTREARRAYRSGIRLWVLTESKEIRTLRDLTTWRSPYGTISGRDIVERIFHLHKAYRTEFVFCRPEETGEKIIEILEGRWKM